MGFALMPLAPMLLYLLITASGVLMAFSVGVLLGRLWEWRIFRDSAEEHYRWPKRPPEGRERAKLDGGSR